MGWEQSAAALFPASGSALPPSPPPPPTPPLPQLCSDSIRSLLQDEEGGRRRGIRSDSESEWVMRVVESSHRCFWDHLALLLAFLQTRDLNDAKAPISGSRTPAPKAAPPWELEVGIVTVWDLDSLTLWEGVVGARALWEEQGREPKFAMDRVCWLCKVSQCVYFPGVLGGHATCRDRSGHPHPFPATSATWVCRLMTLVSYPSQ